MIKASISKNQALLRLIALGENVYFFKFTGDQTYTDDVGVVWNWEGVETLAPTILGIRIGEVFLTKVLSLADCKILDGSWYYSGDMFYIHWTDDAGDWAIQRSIAVINVGGNIDVADSFDIDTLNYSGGSFFNPALDNIGIFGRKINSFKLGIIESSQTQIILNNSSGFYNDTNLENTRGSLMQIFINGEISSTGITTSSNSTEKQITFNALEQRFFYNPIVSNRIINSTDYPLAADDITGQKIPVVYGKVKRSKVIPINTSGLDKTISQTVRFLVTDPSVNPIITSSKLYDSNGFEVTITTSNLAECWVEYTRTAGSEVDLKNFTWEGLVYSSSGMEIIEDAYAKLSNYPYIDSLYDKSTWEAVKDLNAQEVGLTITGDNTIVSGIIEPICQSYQIMIMTNRFGQLTAIQRNLTAPVIYTFESAQMENTSININSDNFSPSVIVEFLEGSVEDYTYRTQIIEDYGTVISNINPIKTVLYNQSDAELLASEIMETVKEPDQIITFTTPYNDLLLNMMPYDIVKADTYTLETYGIEFDYYSHRVKITGRII